MKEDETETKASPAMTKKGLVRDLSGEEQVAMGSGWRKTIGPHNEKPWPQSE